MGQYKLPKIAIKSLVEIASRGGRRLTDWDTAVGKAPEFFFLGIPQKETIKWKSMGQILSRG